MVIDTHLHVWQADPNYPDLAATTVSPLSDVPVELAVQYLSEHNVDRAVLVQPIYPGEDNSYVADCAAAQPDRFAAVCVVDPRQPGGADRLEYWASERGCRGLRLRPRLPGEGAVFGQPVAEGLWQHASQLKVVVSLLAGPEHLGTIGSLAGRFPEMDIVIDHLGYPSVAAGVKSPDFGALLDLSRYPRVFLKLSGQYYYSKQSYPYADCRDLVHAIFDRFGPERLLWGSDFPHVLLKSGYRRCLKLPEREYTFLSQDDLALVMGGNAARLYWSRVSS
jgi:predicted TIM-barrel fold metal-dependent hydrolase